jgi:hypothetical protein
MPGSAGSYVRVRAISSVWLECLLDMQEVTGSSPVSPTIQTSEVRNIIEKSRSTSLLTLRAPRETRRGHVTDVGGSFFRRPIDGMRGLHPVSSFVDTFGNAPKERG